ncbi:hypothetical protein DFH06DRAFT_1471373 [Mycena polygramma]|nr:hypothetical protein DFH06DRAFT_1471373 [Mycena polygramma]
MAAYVNKITYAAVDKGSDEHIITVHGSKYRAIYTNIGPRGGIGYRVTKCLPQGERQWKGDVEFPAKFNGTAPATFRCRTGTETTIGTTKIDDTRTVHVTRSTHPRYPDRTGLGCDDLTWMRYFNTWILVDRYGVAAAVENATPEDKTVVGGCITDKSEERTNLLICSIFAILLNGGAFDNALRPKDEVAELLNRQGLPLQWRDKQDDRPVDLAFGILSGGKLDNSIRVCRQRRDPVTGLPQIRAVEGKAETDESNGHRPNCYTGEKFMIWHYGNDLMISDTYGILATVKRQIELAPQKGEQFGIWHAGNVKADRMAWIFDLIVTALTRQELTLEKRPLMKYLGYHD